MKDDHHEGTTMKDRWEHEADRLNLEVRDGDAQATVERHRRVMELEAKIDGPYGENSRLTPDEDAELRRLYDEGGY